MPTGAPTPPWLPCGRPRAVVRSARLRLAARTLTSTSLGFGRGCGTSRTSIPFSLATPAFIACSVVVSRVCRGRGSVQRHARLLGNIGPFLRLARQERAEFPRRAGARLGAEPYDQVLHVGRLQGLV